jgi:hypothetical protein
MNTLLAAPAGRQRPIDILFTDKSKASDKPLPASLDLKIQASPEQEEGKAKPALAPSSGDVAFLGDMAAVAVPGIPCLGITRDNFMSPVEKAANKISQDIYLTQRVLPPMIPRNPSFAAMRLLERVSESAVALWRNPLQMIIKNWKRRELMHVFNGFFHTAIDDPERYDTFSRNVTWPTFEMA